MLKHPGPLAPLCMTMAMIGPSAWAGYFLIAACTIVAFVILQTIGLPQQNPKVNK